jgi:hypothetical protein
VRIQSPALSKTGIRQMTVVGLACCQRCPA